MSDIDINLVASNHITMNATSTSGADSTSLPSSITSPTQVNSKSSSGCYSGYQSATFSVCLDAEMNEKNFINELVHQQEQKIPFENNLDNIIHRPNKVLEQHQQRSPMCPKACEQPSSNSPSYFKNGIVPPNIGQYVTDEFDTQRILPSKPMPSITQPTTAYLVQTPSGNALLIPSQNTTLGFHQQQHTLQRSPYGITTFQFQNMPNSSELPGNSMTATRNGTVVHSPDVNANNYFSRSDSTASTNVYQTIDAEK